MSPATAAGGLGVGTGAGGGNLSGVGGQFGDTTYTKVFVGGLAWETQKETMKKYFEQFGEILEAVVISDKATGRSKGYGFVTFREPDAAMRACVDAAPVIDGRRANCNLASLGVQRSKPSTPKHGGGRNFRVMSSFQTGFGGGFGAGTTAFSPHYAVQQGIPAAYNFYGYSPYSADYAYPTSYYNVYGGAASQYPIYTTGTGGVMSATAAAFYPSYLNFGDLGSNGGSTTGYTGLGQSYGGMQYPQGNGHMFQYSGLSSAGHGGYPHHYGATPISLAPATPMQSAGMTVALHAPIPHR